MPWYRHRHVQQAIDLLVAFVACVPLQLAPLIAAHDGDTATGGLAVAAMGGALLLRRRHPRAVLAVTLAGGLAVRLAGFAIPPMPAVVAAATVAAYRPREESLWAAALVLALWMAILDRPGPSAGIRWLYEVAVTAGAWAVGDAFRARRTELEALHERAERAERDREERARRAVAEEQGRIARELHDVVAHHVSVMVVQAAAAEELAEREPGRAREALASIEATGREAMAELRRLLGVVRPLEPAGKAPYEPQPGLDRLEAALAPLRAAGLDVTVTYAGARRELPTGVELSAFRIVQEALTNTLRHAGARRADVVVDYLDGEVVVAVRDDGAGGGAGGGRSDGGGHGIAGMRERAALLGGELEAGPAPGGGFLVRARLPVA